MTITKTTIALALVIAATPAVSLSQDSVDRRGWRVGVAAGPARVDDLVGSPVVPTATSERTIGARGLFGVRVGWIGDAGFYSLNALTLDLGLGYRIASTRAEGSVLVGPSALLGGDSDGTPYAAIGPHVTLAGIAWMSNRIGLQAAGIARVWTSGDGTTFKPAALGGLTVQW